MFGFPFQKNYINFSVCIKSKIFNNIKMSYSIPIQIIYLDRSKTFYSSSYASYAFTADLLTDLDEM